MAKDLGRRVFANSFFNFVTFFINRFGGLFFTIIIARALEPELFGLYNLSLSIVMIILTFSNLGIDEAMARYVARSYKNNPGKAKAYFDYLLKLKITVVLLAGIILIVLAKPISLFYGSPSLTFPLVVSAFYLIISSISQFISSFFYTFQKVNIYAIKEAIFQISRITFLPLFFLFIFNKVIGVFLALIISSILVLIFSLVVLNKKYSFLFRRAKKEKLDKKEIFNYLKFLTFGSISGVLLLYVDILILGKFVSLEYIGFYKAASSIVLSVAALISISPVVYPLFSQLSKNKLNLIFNKIIYFTSIISIPITLGLVFVGKHFIVAIYGYEYLPSVIPFYALSFLVFSFSVGDFFAIALNAKGKSKQTAFSTLLATILNIILNLIFIYFLLPYGEIYAVLGAAIATFISRTASYFVLSFYSRKLLEIKIRKSIFIKPIIASLVMALFLILFSNIYYQKINLVLGVVEIILAAAVYFITLFLIKGIRKDDVRYILDLAKPKLVIFGKINNHN